MVQTCILSDDFIEQYNKLPSNLSEEERREAIIRLLTAFFTSSMLTIHSFRSDVKNLNSITQKEVKFGRYLDNGFSRPGDLPQYFNLDNSVSYSLTKAGHEGSTISKIEYSVTRNNATTYYTKEDFLNKINAGEFDLDDVIVKANTKDPNIQQALRDYEVRNKDRFDVNTKKNSKFEERSLDDPEFFKAVKDGNLSKLDEVGLQQLGKLSAVILDEGTELTMSQKSKHIFEGKLHPKPYLDEMAGVFGGRRPFIRHILEKLNGRFPTVGTFDELIVNINGRNLTVRVFINVSGIPIINTIF